MVKSFPSGLTSFPSPHPTSVRSFSCSELSDFEYEKEEFSFIPLFLPSSPFLTHSTPLPDVPRSLKRNREDADDETSMERLLPKPIKKLKTKKSCVSIYVKRYTFPLISLVVTSYTHSRSFCSVACSAACLDACGCYQEIGF